MTRTPIMTLLLFAAACSSSALAPPAPVDAGVDLAAVSCDELKLRFALLVDQARACARDDECTFVQPDCGLLGLCWAPVSKSARPQIDAYLAAWRAGRCGEQEPPCAFRCASAPAPACQMGKCGPF